MELLVTIRNMDLLYRIGDRVDGVIAGSYFAMGYHLSLEELREIFKYCLERNLKFYVVMDSFISEDEIEVLDSYMKVLSEWNVDGIYFHDLSIMSLAKKHHLMGKLIYDGMTVLCNSLETAFYLSKGIDGCVISRELTLEEIENIILNNEGKIDMQIFGHQRLSYSKRNFLTNYFKEIHLPYPYRNKETLTIVEEQRNDRMPIIEDEYGTRIYSDYIFEIYDELPELRNKIRRGIVDTMFLSNGLIIQALDDYRMIDEDNRKELKEELERSFPASYSSGFLYTKTNISKDEQN